MRVEARAPIRTIDTGPRRIVTGSTPRLDGPRYPIPHREGLTFRRPEAPIPFPKNNIIFDRTSLKEGRRRPQKELLGRRIKERLAVSPEQRPELGRSKDILRAMREKERREREEKLRAVRAALKHAQEEMRRINHIPGQATEKFKVKNDARIQRGKDLAALLNVALRSGDMKQHGLTQRAERTRQRIQYKVGVWREKAARVRQPRPALAM